MKSNDLQGLVFKDRAKTNDGVGLRRWATGLFLYPALELMLAGGTGIAMGKLSGATAALYFVPSVALLVGVALIWAKKGLPTYLSLIPAVLYLLIAIPAGKGLSLPAMSVMAASVCAILLGVRLSGKRA